MRRFTLTIPNQKTPIELLYGIDGLLRKIDFAGLPLAEEQVKWVKGMVPVKVDEILEAFARVKNITIAEAELQITFEDFSREYPYKRNTHLARAYWPKMTAQQQLHAFYAAMDYRKFLEVPANSWQKPMIADKWLKTAQFLNNWKEL